MQQNFRTLKILSAGALMTAAAVVTEFEGRSLVAYVDPVGIPTICDGITPGVKLGDVATAKQCDDKLTLHLINVLSDLSDCIEQDLPKHEWAALVSWAYNVGTGAACSSTLVRKVNNGLPPADYCSELHRWVYAGGRVLGGLERRRSAEYRLCLGTDNAYMGNT